MRTLCRLARIEEHCTVNHININHTQTSLSAVADRTQHPRRLGWAPPLDIVKSCMSNHFGRRPAALLHHIVQHHAAATFTFHLQLRNVSELHSAFLGANRRPEPPALSSVEGRPPVVARQRSSAAAGEGGCRGGRRGEGKIAASPLVPASPPPEVPVVTARSLSSSCL